VCVCVCVIIIQFISTLMDVGNIVRTLRFTK